MVKFEMKRNAERFKAVLFLTPHLLYPHCYEAFPHKLFCIKSCLRIKLLFLKVFYTLPKHVFFSTCLGLHNFLHSPNIDMIRTRPHRRTVMPCHTRKTIIIATSGALKNTIPTQRSPTPKAYRRRTNHKARGTHGNSIGTRWALMARQSKIAELA